MKTIETIGDNYFGHYDRIRYACRAVVIQDGMLLTSYMVRTDTFMTPGGGMEPGEDEKQCCLREAMEETGYVLELSECALVLNEYYENVKYTTYYFPGRVTGVVSRKMTEAEKKDCLEPRWMPFGLMKDIFSCHAFYADKDEMKRGLYEREYNALCGMTGESYNGGMIRIDEETDLVPYYPSDIITLGWYQDPELCRQVDNTDHVYDIGTLRAMYRFLSTHGDCFYIRLHGELVGDISLRDNGEIAAVVRKESQNMHIGRKCVGKMVELAREKGLSEVRAVIYSFNEQSKRMFSATGFRQTGEELWIRTV